MTDILGPASSLNSVSSRPSDGRQFGALDTWFRDCTTPASQDGTQVAAAWLNQVTGLFRGAIRGNGLKGDGVNPVVAQDQSDSMLLNSINQLIQRGQATYGLDTGTSDTLALAPVGAVAAEYKTGMAFLIRKGPAANVTTAPTLNVNGLGPIPIVSRTGAPLAAGDLPANAGLSVWYDGQNFRMFDLTVSDVQAIIAAASVRRYHAAGDADVAIATSDGVVATSNALTAPRTWTLPLARNVAPGTVIALLDPVGAASDSATITFHVSGSDTVNGRSSYALTTAFFQILAYSDGVSRWTFQIVDPIQTPEYEILFALLQSSLAGLLDQFAAFKLYVLAELAALQARQTTGQSQAAGQAISATFTDVEFFLDTSKSTPSAPNYSCSLGSGLTFPSGPGFVQDQALPATSRIQNTYGQQTSNSGGYTILTRSGTTHPTPIGSGSAPFQQDTVTFGAATLPIKRRGLPWRRYRFGKSHQAQATTQLLASGDANAIFAISPGDLAYDPAWGPWQTTTTRLSHKANSWADVAAQDYWTPIVSQDTTQGQQLCSQVYQLPFPISLNQVVFSFTSYYAVGITSKPVGNVRVLVSKCDENNRPDLTQTLADVSVVPGAAAINGNDTNMAANFASTIIPANTPFALTFCFDVGGLLGMATSNVYAGQFYLYYNGAWIASGSNVVNLVLYADQFLNAQAQAAIDIGPGITQSATMIAAGGCDSLDIAVPALVPDGCTFQILVNGFDIATADPAAVLGNKFSQLNMRIVAAANGAVSPIFDLSNLHFRVSRAGDSFLHESITFNPPAAVTTITEQAILQGFDPTLHTYNPSLETGAGLATVQRATPTPMLQPDGTYIASSSWTVGSPASAFRLRREGTKQDAAPKYRVAQSNYQAK